MVNPAQDPSEGRVSVLAAKPQQTHPKNLSPNLNQPESEVKSLLTWYVMHCVNNSLKVTLNNYGDGIEKTETFVNTDVDRSQTITFKFTKPQKTLTAGSGHDQMVI